MINSDFQFETEIESPSDVLVIPLEEDAPVAAPASAPLETTAVPIADGDAVTDGGAVAGAAVQAGTDDVDTFQAGDLAPDVDGLVHVAGFVHGQDLIDFSGLGAIADSDFATATADDFAAALASANGIMAGAGENVVAVQVGADVIVFADTGDTDEAGSAVLLVGRTLADVSASDFG